MLWVEDVKTSGRKRDVIHESPQKSWIKLLI